jgi:RNAse (barnase) inhibitor barstar
MSAHLALLVEHVLDVIRWISWAKLGGTSRAPFSAPEIGALLLRYGWEMHKTHKVAIDGSLISDFVSFHEVFKDALGFPEFYGRNMDAWIDCMGDIHEDTGMSNVLLPLDTSLTLDVTNVRHMEATCPGVLVTLLACTAFVNAQRITRLNKSAAPIYLLVWN